jgi:dihydroorotate dehydrogenase
LRELQDRDALDQVLATVQNENRKEAGRGAAKPVLVKIAPDLTFSAIDEVLQVTEKHQLAGIVATNTTIERPTSNDEVCRKTYAETGGLSGAPLRQRSTEIIRYIFERTQGKLPIIGVGGIFNAEHAWEKIRAGASLVQCYTGLVYEGPGIARTIVRALTDRLGAEGFASVSQAVGR